MDDKTLEENNRLVEQKPTVRNRSPVSKTERMRRKEEHQIRHGRKKIIFYTVAVSTVVLFILGIALIFNCFSADDSIVGTWDYDAVTIYRFDGNGKGALKLPNGSYAFSYKIDGERLMIDFESEEATDSTYTFSMTDGKLKLTAEGASGSVYVLKKAETQKQ